MCLRNGLRKRLRPATATCVYKAPQEASQALQSAPASLPFSPSAFPLHTAPMTTLMERLVRLLFATLMRCISQSSLRSDAVEDQLQGARNNGMTPVAGATATAARALHIRAWRLCMHAHNCFLILLVPSMRTHMHRRGRLCGGLLQAEGCSHH